MKPAQVTRPTLLRDPDEDQSGARDEVPADGLLGNDVPSATETAGTR
jgi:hypothetical protein